MFLFRKHRKTLAVLLSFALVLPGISAYADNKTPAAEEEILVEEASIASELKEEASELDELTPGEDYVDREGVFLADSLSEAEQVAAEYNAELVGFDYGVATVRFKEGTAAALEHAAALSSVSTLIEPNYTAELLDVDDDFGEILEEAAALGELDSDNDNGDSSDVTDPLSSKQYFHKMIKDEEALKIASGNGVTVAVLDTGVNTEHEDLNTNDKEKPGYIERRWIPEVASKNSAGKVDEAHSGIDYNVGHGTHVSGLIAATKGNSKGGYGVAPAVKIDSIQVTTERSFSLKNIAIGIRMAIDRKVDVISMSMGSTSNASYLGAAIDEAYNNGIICIAAAGNNGSEKEYYPAAYEHCIAVGANTEKDGKLADFSNYGDWVDIVAPGNAVWSSFIRQDLKDDGTWQGISNKDFYKTMNGTSQATPMVSAVTALCLSSNPEFMKEKSSERFDIIRTILQVTSDGKEYSSGDKILYGMVQADQAVNLAKSFKLHPENTLVDEAGHYGAVLSGYISEKKSFKLRIGNSDGQISDKGLTKSATWNSSDTGKVSVSKGKVKCVSGKAGDRVIITAEIGGNTLFYFLKVHKTVKKMGLLRGDMKILGKTDKTVHAGDTIKIAYPYSAISDNEVGVYYEKKKSKLSVSVNNSRSLADGRFVYDIKVSKRDLNKLVINKSDKNGDPLSITPIRSGSVIKITYKLLDGSKKKFTVKLRVA